MVDQLRIPIPPDQRWEELRTRILPVLCLAATIVLCGILWRRHAQQLPLVIGEIQAESQEVRSPADGRLLPVAKFSDGAWPLFSDVKAGETVARVQIGRNAADVAEVLAPLSGVVTANHARPEAQVWTGDPLLRISSAQAEFIVCHLPDGLQQRVETGQSVWVRHREHGAAWLETTVQSIGPQVESVPAHQLADGIIPAWGLPIHLKMPPALAVRPGSLVEVRFAN